MAVYPVDVRGLQTGSAFQAASGASLSADPLRGVPRADPSLDASAADHLAAGRIAQDTGGRAFYNVNDLSKAVESAISEGSSYYTLTYTPTDSAWNNSFRKIEVKLAAKGYVLAYRRGYYAVNPDSRRSALLSSVKSAPGKPTSVPQLSTLRRAMVHGVPGPTEIRFKVRVLPTPGEEDEPAINNRYTQDGLAVAHGSFRRYIVDFDAEAHDFVLTPTADGKFRLEFELAALVYDRMDGRLFDTVSTTIVRDITPVQRNQVLYAGLPIRLQVSVPARGADDSIRIGIHDLPSDRVGAVEVPVASVAGLRPVEVPAKEAPPRTGPAKP